MREKLYRLYNQLLPKNKEVFNKIYGSVYDIKDEDIEWATKQCENTIIRIREIRDNKINQILYNDHTRFISYNRW